jgi:hypothetical protein
VLEVWRTADRTEGVSQARRRCALSMSRPTGRAHGSKPWLAFRPLTAVPVVPWSAP